ncbi:MAG TPA: hypothetical protein DD706_21295 [Nitrospiraceae bacterium]|nr:hypothetical protein [Nitrospiraceae bacterium]
MIERTVTGRKGHESNRQSLASRFMVPGLALALLGCMTLLWIPLPSPTILRKVFYDFCHVPLFGGVALILLYLARQLGEPRGWSVGSQYGLAFIGAVILGALAEGMQSFNSSRFAEWSDFLLNVLGAVGALGLSFTYDPRFTGCVATWRLAPKKYLVHAGVGLLVVIALSPVVVWTYAYWDRAIRFPSLVQFSSAWEMMFVNGRDCAVEIVSPPSGWKKSQVDTVGHMMCYPAHYPGIRLEESYPDWRGFSHFRVDVYSELPVARSLTIRIDDAHHNHDYADRFNQTVTISPGLNHIHIPLEDIRHAPVGRELDLSAIKTVSLFAIDPPEEFSLYVDNIRLE